jgi:hypothetical protein
MRLSHRSARPEDFARCFDLMGEPHAYEPALRPEVPRLWADWLRQGVMTAHIMEELIPLAGTRIVGLGICVCVRESFIAETLSDTGRPFIRAEIIRRTLAGERLVLNQEEMRAANRDGGLTLLFLNDAVSHRELPDDQCLLVDAHWGEALNELRGCHIKSMWLEVYGTKKRLWSEGCGIRVVRDWSDHWKKSSTPVPRDDVHPYLMGITREQALAAPGTHASFLFMHIPPHFGFSARQQEMLANALYGATDDELAQRLNVSPSGIKKRWISIYDQVSSAMPGWLERDTEAAARGSEKRRHLLNYLRQRPEELHPACATRE